MKYTEIFSKTNWKYLGVVFYDAYIFALYPCNTICENTGLKAAILDCPRLTRNKQV